MPKGAWQKPSRSEFSDREWLVAQYCDAGKTAEQIAGELGVSKPTVLRWLRKHQIARRRSGPTTRLTTTDYESIGQRYLAGESLDMLAGPFGVSVWSVVKALESQGIARRPAVMGERRRQSRAWPTLTQDGWLAREYVERSRTLNAIAAELGCAIGTVSKALALQGIPVRHGVANRRGPTAARTLSARHRRQVRDGYGACALCAAGTDLEVHHRDADRTNDNPENLVVLCRDCHAVAEWFIRPVEARFRGLATSLPV